MARSYTQPGAVLTHPNAGESDIAVGDVVVMADTVGVALVDIPVDESGSVAIEGTFRLPKATGTAWEQGARLDWDASAGAFTIGGGGVAGCAIAAEPAASADAVGAVKLAGAGLDSK